MRNNTIIENILKYIDKLQAYVDGKNLDSFNADSMLQEACAFCLSQIGELVWKMDDDFKKSYPQIPWSQISGLRHHIVHDYEGIVQYRIWDTIDKHIPIFKQQLEEIITANNS